MTQTSFDFRPGDQLVERALDGATIISTNNDAIMVTPAGRNGMIFVTGRAATHPLDTIPSLLSWESVTALRDTLTAAIEQHT